MPQGQGSSEREHVTITVERRAAEVQLPCDTPRYGGEESRINRGCSVDDVLSRKVRVHDKRTDRSRWLSFMSLTRFPEYVIQCNSVVCLRVPESSLFVPRTVCAEPAVLRPHALWLPRSYHTRISCNSVRPTCMQSGSTTPSILTTGCRAFGWWSDRF